MSNESTDLALAAIEDPTATPDQILAAMDAIDVVIERAKELKAQRDAALIAHIKATGKPVEYGTTRWVLTHPKDTKCVDKNAAIKATLDAVGGDVDRFADLLVSDPLKYGSCRSVLDHAVYEHLFRTEVKDKLEKRLVKLDTRYLE